MTDKVIKLTDQVIEVLERRADELEITLDQLLEQILHTYADAMHSIQEEEMRRGYTDYGDLNIEFCN